MKKQLNETSEFIKKLGIETDAKGRVKIDVGVLEKIKPMPSGNYYKEVILRDSNLMGFRARVNPGGKITFFFRFRPKGLNSKGRFCEKQSITLGDWYNKKDPKTKNLIGLTPPYARKLAEEMKIKIALKEDPWSIVKERKRGKSLLSVHSEWIDKRLPSANYKIKSVIDYKSRYNLYIKCNGKSAAHKKLYRSNPAVFDKIKQPIKELTKNDYIALHNAVSKHAKYSANRLIEDLRLVEKYAIEIGVLEKRVVVFKKKELNNEVDRLDKEDPYSVEEMRRYRSGALELIKSMRLHYLVPALCLLATGLLGGRSKSMIFSLRWDQINYASNTLKFLDTKNGSTITLDFDYRLKAILRIMLQHRQTINHRDKRYAYVFPTAYKHFKTKHINDPRRTHNSIIELSKLKYKCIHFLRHSWATNSFEATGDILSVKEMGGWQDIKSVQKYIHVSTKLRKIRLAQMRLHTNKRTHAV